MKPVFYIAILLVAFLVFVFLVSKINFGAVASEIGEKICGVLRCEV
ncbi:MAG: hypothetical protein GXO63_03470 [Candidatus Micrarchaeota archaeon]|nr:hypothetical protein [Candidatus Micrarchaeota archaeon]